MRSWLATRRLLLILVVCLVWLALLSGQGTVMPAPKAVFLDNSGNPLSGGKLYTYSAGTTTALATYSDSALTTANANPVVLDSAGRATVFLSATSYKFVLKTSADVEVWTQDNVDATPSGNGLNVDILGTVNASVAARDCIVLSNGDGSRTAGQWYKCDADDADISARPEFVGFAVNAISASASGLIRLHGSMSSFSGLTAGSTYYMSGTAAAITATVPTTTYPRIVGVASSSTVLDIAPRAPIALETVTTQTAAYTALVTDQIIQGNSASAFTVTLYACSGNIGRQITIKNINTGIVTVSRAGSDTIDTGLTSLTLGYQSSVTLEVTTATTWRLVVRNATMRPYVTTLADVANTASQTTFCSFTVPANDLADGDILAVEMAVLVKNNKGTSGTITWDVAWGATSVTLTGSPTLTDNATERKWIIRWFLQRVGSDVWIRDLETGDTDWSFQFDSAGRLSTVTNVAVISAPTLTSDQTVALKATLSAAAASFYWKPQAARAWRNAAR